MREITEQQHALLDAMTGWDRDRKIGAMISQITDINYRAEDGWEPVNYDTYDKDTGWSYKTVSVNGDEPFYFFRHINTGKLYRRNQSMRISRYTWKYNTLEG